MDQEEHGHEHTPARAPAVWTPEDAANFLTAAMKEAQRPLAEALARPSVPVRVVYVGVFAALVFLGGLFFQLYQLQTRATEAEEDRLELALASGRTATERETVTDELSRLQTQVTEARREAALEKEAAHALRQQAAQQESGIMTVLRERFQTAERERDEARREADSLKASQEPLRRNESKLKESQALLAKTKTDAEKARKENALLLKQIEAQKARITALQAELEAAQAMADLDAEPAEPETKPEPAPATPEEPQPSKPEGQTGTPPMRNSASGGLL